MKSFDILKRPILTEKTYAEMQMEPNGKYTFEVDKNANKIEIALAFYDIFNIRPESVNTSITKPAKVRTGTKYPGFTSLVKKAIITLPKGIKLNILGDEVEQAKEEGKQTTSKGTEVKEKQTSRNIEDPKIARLIKKEIKNMEKQDKKEIAKKDTHAAKKASPVIKKASASTMKKGTKKG